MSLQPKASAIERPHVPSLERIQGLDGLRGLAIVLVVGFHAFARWAEHIPWATVHGDWAVFKYGYLGVQLFFLISGFVIYLTLDRCLGWREFMFRRWLRLFPAMLIATLLILFTAPLLPERPGGAPPWLDALPGLLLIQPMVLEKIFSTPLALLEGAFWSLLVEVNFYVIFGAMYFVNKNRAVVGLMLLVVISFSFNALTHVVPGFEFRRVGAVINHVLQLQFFGWFAVGALLYRRFRDKDHRFTVLALLVLPLAILETGWTDPGVALACLVIVAVFAATLFNGFVARVLASRLFVFWGGVSYPLYLIHESAMVALTVKTHAHFGFIPGMLTPLPGLILLVGVAWLIERWLEPWVRRQIRSLIFYLKPTLSG